MKVKDVIPLLKTCKGKENEEVNFFISTYERMYGEDLCTNTLSGLPIADEETLSYFNESEVACIDSDEKHMITIYIKENEDQLNANFVGRPLSDFMDFMQCIAGSVYYHYDFEVYNDSMLHTRSYVRVDHAYDEALSEVKPDKVNAFLEHSTITHISEESQSFQLYITVK